MDKKRKFRIWLTAFGSVLLVFLAYNFLIDTPEIRIDGYDESGDDIVVPDFPDQEGDTRVGSVNTARFRILDEVTKELRRVYGFEKLLNPGQTGGQWQMLKPYMYIFDDKFNCEITSDMGDVIIEEVAGKSSPTEAKLYENVVIRVIPKQQGQSASTIYLDDLFYNSERSEYSTEGPIKVISQDGVLEGKGMLLIYNNALTRVEFLRIVELDYIRLTDASKLNLEGRTDAGEEEPTVESEVAGTSAKVVSDAPSEQTPSAKVSETADEEKTLPSKCYKCSFNKDVAIRYGNELIVTSQKEIVINNILWGKSEKSGTGDSSAAMEPAEPGAIEPVAVEQEVAVVAVDLSLEDEAAVAEESGSETKAGVEVLVKCSGGLVFRPMDSFITPERSDNLLTSGTFGANLRDILDKYEDVDWGIDNIKDPPALFGARTVEYDRQTGGAVAKAPVELTLYTDPNKLSDDNDLIPSVITASEKTEFFADENRRINKIVFSGDVVGSQEVSTPLYMQTSSFYGQKLIVDLYGQGGSGIRHVSVDEGKVKLEMQRFVGDKVINYVQLKCKRIDYDMINEIITSVGPGKIEINNENAPYVKEVKSSKKDKSGKKKVVGSLSLKKPCYAYIDGFDRLKWMPLENRITADGKDKSVYMSYLPRVDGKIGQVVRSSVTHMQADFVETVAGRSELASLNAWGGVYYKEQAGNVFSGDELTYDVGESMMVITCAEGRDCLANGALVPRIEYNLESGKIRTKLSPSPGVISMPKRKKSLKKPEAF